MKKKLIFILLFLTSCGFEPIYSSKNSNDFIFKKIETIGEKTINRRIISAISAKENSISFSHKKLILENEKNIIETSKNTKGQPDSFKMTIKFKITLIDNKNNSSEKIFYEEFSYKNKDNKFDLSEYEIKLENDLIDKIIEDLIIYINIQ
tara:strand:+ start:645 stop:1094 length:450 start_codon:yes stop_codon:yes gene_type:complete